MSVDASLDARTGDVVAEFGTSSEATVRETLDQAAAAAPAVAAATPLQRAQWLIAIADALEDSASAEGLVHLADRETGLGEPRLVGELARCAAQLRFYGRVAAEGSFLAATIDHRLDAAPDLRRMRIPLGPVCVLGASNFPFGFGTLGHDTASALAAGCPVVVKVHPAHPATGTTLGDLATQALRRAGAPVGAFAVLSGFEAGQAMVTAPQVAAVAFTGSTTGGLALWRLANSREIPIPVYSEMGTVNPVVMSASAVTRTAEIAAGFVGSFTLGSGQFCTKPGLLLAPAGHDVPAQIQVVLQAAAPRGWLLTNGIADAYRDGVGDLVAAGANVLARVTGPDDGWAGDVTLLNVRAQDIQPGSRFTAECFGPVALVVEYAHYTELDTVLASLQGALAASVMTGPDDPDTVRLVSRLVPLVGRVSVDDWPTGVATTWAQQHGGPWPATTRPEATSVGAAALDRFTRPVAWQSVPNHALPAPLQDANPWRIPQRIDGRLVP